MLQNIILLTLILVCTGCGGTKTPTEISIPKDNPKLETQGKDYIVVYSDENIVIQEKFLGLVSDWEWNEFVMPEARIPFSDQDRFFVLEKFDECYEQFKTKDSCTFSIETPTNKFGFIFDRIMGGNCEIRRNGTLIWTGQMNGGTGLSISSIKNLDDWMVVDYIDINNETTDRSMLDTILLIKDASVIDYVLDDGYTSAFAPYETQGKLAFFARKGGELFFVIDGQEIKLDYDNMFNQHCCWDGPPIQISGNGEVIDFFAQKEGGWYHVQIASN